VRRRRFSLSVGGVLDRSLVREVLGPTALGFGTYTFFLLMRPIFGLMEQVFVRGVPFHQALRFLSLTVPHVVVLTVPMSYLFGVLLALGRMNGDNEITALQAAGISMRRVLVPVLALSLVFGALNAWLTLIVMPRANRELRVMKVEMFTSAKSLGRVEPRVFNESFPNLLLYVEDVDPVTSVWHNVLLYDRSNPDEELLTLARSGRLVAERPTANDGVDAPEGVPQGGGEGTPWLLLEDATTHQFSSSHPATYRRNVNQTQLVKLIPNERGTVEVSLGMRERSTRELVTLLDQLAAGTTDSEGERRRKETLIQVLMELHSRLALPVACVAFALIALPLGIGSRGGGRGRGFILSIGVILAYYIIFNNGRLLAQEGRVPVWVGSWLANVLVAGVALVMMRRMGYWLGERRRGERITSRLARAWRAHREASRPRPAREAAGLRPPLTGSIPTSLQKRRYGTRFPAMLDRYVATRLLTPLLLVLLTASALYVVVDLTDRIDDLAKSSVSASVAVAYYANLIPQVLLDVTPLGLLIAVLIALTIMERQVELTAFKAAGISLFRVMVPVLLLAAGAATGLWFLGESVVPQANREAQRLLDRIKGRETSRSYGADRLWLLSRDGSTLYNFLQFDPQAQTMLRFSMFRLDSNFHLTFQLFADRVQYQHGGWIADSGWFRKFLPDGSDVFHSITEPMELGVPEAPSYFGQEHHQPGEMSYRELESYITELTESGYRPVKLIVRWYQKITYPLSAFVMVLLALPFGLNRGGRRITTINGVALALALGIGYFLLVAVFGKMGEADILPPLLGAWAPVGLAALFAFNRMTTLRT
jgi:LPS export ABC transporter permease LptG/LPS export ABC transporter permease LptF